jgi:hypothetical protein
MTKRAPAIESPDVIRSVISIAWFWLGVRDIVKNPTDDKQCGWLPDSNQTQDRGVISRNEMSKRRKQALPSEQGRRYCFVDPNFHAEENPLYPRHQKPLALH